ncbi:uncharacterized protein LOC125490179 [Plutella xylostella]|uniref:uncharacterized protein LOC125490179 n=1 Tax=Plutella xylostella TaxID=51655 RepID=UPI002032A3FF|nr:uncharacterized protein LOC125490179 [Plutella xylostella]
MLARRLLALAALAAAAAAAADPPRPRLIDFNPWAWLPTSRNRSPSIMDYFFPPSRTPKHSNLDPAADRNPPLTTLPQTTLEEKSATTIEDRATTRKSSATKIKTTVPPTTVTVQKKKKTSSKTTTAAPTTIETKTTRVPETVGTTIRETTTAKPTKHYTIKPLVRTTTETLVQETDSTSSESDSTETVSGFESTQTTAAADADTAAAALADARSTDAATASTPDATEPTTPPDAPDSREGYLPLRDKPQQTHVKINEQTNKETVPLPAGSTSVLAKPTKYHYYPHNQHIYLLPECAIQQVCNAVYVRLNYTQPLCACPARYRDPCSASLNADDLHTTRLTTDSKKKYAKRAVTLVKTCEAVSEMRECRAPRDWSLLALQNIRTGKSHYLVICRCPENHILEGPMSHDQPTYASVPGIRVYGMVCVRPTPISGYNANRYTSSVTIQSTTNAYKVDYSQAHSYTEKPIYNRYQNYPGPSYYNRMSRVSRVRRNAANNPPFPWHTVRELAVSLHWVK